MLAAHGRYACVQRDVTPSIKASNGGYVLLGWSHHGRVNCTVQAEAYGHDALFYQVAETVQRLVENRELLQDDVVAIPGPEENTPSLQRSVTSCSTIVQSLEIGSNRVKFLPW